MGQLHGRVADWLVGWLDNWLTDVLPFLAYTTIERVGRSGPTNLKDVKETSLFSLTLCDGNAWMALYPRIGISEKS